MGWLRRLDASFFAKTCAMMGTANSHLFLLGMHLDDDEALER
jgi:hypothetical protein